MKQVIKPNQEIEIATPAEIAELLQPGQSVERVRAPMTLQLDGNGSGKVTVYTVPAGSKFEVRRVFFSLQGNVPVDPITGAVPLNAAGHWVAYLRSDTLIEYAQPVYSNIVQVPGVQTWSSQQGPELRNKEVFQVQALGLTANAYLSIYAEGILSGPLST